MPRTLSAIAKDLSAHRAVLQKWTLEGTPSAAVIQEQVSVVEALAREIEAKDQRPELLRKASDSDQFEVELLLRKEISEADHDRLASRVQEQEALIEKQTAQIRELIIGVSVLMSIVGYFVTGSK